MIHRIRRKATISTQDLILDAAERIFGEHGFGGASMREIAQVAGVAQALLHYHFRNKEALYQAVFDQDLELENYNVVGAPYSGAVGRYVPPSADDCANMWTR